jgi:c-di-GMP-binding flagellar brake protein YcgR
VKLTVEKSVAERERRKFHRVHIPIEVRAKHSDLSVVYAKGLDLSVGGIGILSPEELPEGKMVELAMNIPPVIARGQVVSKKEVETRGANSSKLE